MVTLKLPCILGPNDTIRGIVAGGLYTQGGDDYAPLSFPLCRGNQWGAILKKSAQPTHRKDVKP